MLKGPARPRRVRRVIGYALVVAYVGVFAFAFEYMDAVPALALFFAGGFPLGWALRRLGF